MGTPQHAPNKTRCVTATRSCWPPPARSSALEMMVLDGALPAFRRAFAWAKLLQIWGGLRSDDLQGLLPAQLKLLSAGL